VIIVWTKHIKGPNSSVVYKTAGLELWCPNRWACA